MKKRMKRWAGGWALAAALVMGCCLGNASAEVKFGILPRLHAVELYSMFSPLAAYLTKEAGEQVTLVIPKDFESFKSMAKTGELDLGFANSLVYIQLKQEAGIEALAVSAEPKSGTKFRGIIITRKDSGIENARDLKGKKLIFVDKDSAGGYIFQMLLLNKAGLDVRKDFTLLAFANKHDNVAMAVVNKVADAGGIREEDFDKMKGKMDTSQLKIVAYTDYFPNWPVFAAPKLNSQTESKIKAALLKLKPNTAEAERVLGPAKLAGFATVSDKDYDLLRRAAALVGAY